MTIRIDQRGRQYFVYLNDTDKTILQGQWTANWFKRGAQFTDTNNLDRLIIKTSFRLDFWNISFSIQLPQLGYNGQIACESFKGGQWRLIRGADTYDYYIQKGHKKSLYKNGQQVASYDKTYFQLFERDTIFITANDDEHIELLLSFVIAFDLGSDNDGTTVTFDFGNISSGKKLFDSNWRPKTIKQSV